MACLIFVDVEAKGPSPFSGKMTEFGACLYNEFAESAEECVISEFHGKLWSRKGNFLQEDTQSRDPEGAQAARHVRVMMEFLHWVQNAAVGRGTPKFVSDNPAFDWQWVSFAFDSVDVHNPFGYSARRLGDYFSGLVGDFFRTQQYKLLRITKHDHNPVHDARGNAEAFWRLQHGERPPLTATKEQKKEYY